MPLWTPKGLGGKRSAYDRRNYVLRLSGTPAVLPSRIDLRTPFPLVVPAQGQTNGCTGAALAYLHQYVQYREGAANPFLPSQLFAYYNDRLEFGQQGVDSGGTTLTGMKGLHQYGVCHDGLWPYDASKVIVRPSDAAYADAAAYKAATYYALPYGPPNYTPDLVTLKTVLASGYPVIFGLVLFAQSQQGAVADGIITDPSPTDAILGGHELVLMGYDDQHRTGDFLFSNWWGEEWGDKGNGYLSYEYLTQAFLYQGSENGFAQPGPSTLTYDHWTMSLEGTPAVSTSPTTIASALAGEAADLAALQAGVATLATDLGK